MSWLVALYKYRMPTKYLKFLDSNCPSRPLSPLLPVNTRQCTTGAPFDATNWAAEQLCPAAVAQLVTCFHQFYWTLRQTAKYTRASPHHWNVMTTQTHNTFCDVIFRTLFNIIFSSQVIYWSLRDLHARYIPAHPMRATWSKNRIPFNLLGPELFFFKF